MIIDEELDAVIRDARIELARLRGLLSRTESAYADLLLDGWLGHLSRLPAAFLFCLLAPIVAAYLRRAIRRIERAAAIALYVRNGR